MYAEQKKLISIIPVSTDAYKKISRDCFLNNNYRFYGVTLPQNPGETLCKFQFDLLPSDDNDFQLNRKNLTIMKKGQDEEEQWTAHSKAEDEMIEKCGEIRAPSKSGELHQAII